MAYQNYILNRAILKPYSDEKIQKWVYHVVSYAQECQQQKSQLNKLKNVQDMGNFHFELQASNGDEIVNFENIFGISIKS